MNQYLKDGGVYTKGVDGPVEISVIIDQSGSMQGRQSDVIGSFNRFLEEQRALPGQATLTLTLFADYANVVVAGADLQNIADLTPTTYRPSGSTALLDAVGKTMSSLNARGPGRAVIVIITDGEENASKHYNIAQVRDYIVLAEARGWKVLFLGANIDAFKIGSMIGVAQFNTANFVASASGVRGMSAGFSGSVSNYRSSTMDSHSLNEAVASATAVEENLQKGVDTP